MNAITTGEHDKRGEDPSPKGNVINASNATNA
jgi:hypothetical protein